MNAEWEIGGKNILLFLVAMSLGYSLSYPSSTSDLDDSESGGRTHHRKSMKHNHTHHSSNSTKHRHKHNNSNGYNHIGEEVEQDLEHHVMEPPEGLFENLTVTEGYPADLSYGYWPEQDEFPWYVFCF